MSPLFPSAVTKHRRVVFFPIDKSNNYAPSFPLEAKDTKGGEWTLKSIRFYMKPKTGLEGSGKTAEMVGNTPFGTIETIGGKKLSVPGWKLCPLVLHYFPNMDVYSYINFAYVIEWSAFDGPDKSMNGKVVFAKPKTVSRSERVGFTPRYRTRYYQVPSEEKIVSFNFTVIPTGVINGDSAYSYFEKLRREKYNAIIKAIRK